MKNLKNSILVIILTVVNSMLFEKIIKKNVVRKDTRIKNGVVIIII